MVAGDLAKRQVYMMSLYMMSISSSLLAAPGAHGGEAMRARGGRTSNLVVIADFVRKLLFVRIVAQKIHKHLP